VTLLCVFLSMTSVMIYLQVRFSFHYFIAIGIPAIVLSMWLIMQTTERNLKNNDTINKLTEEELNDLLIMYSLKTENQKQNTKSSFIFFAVISIVIAIITYVITK
jgi:uncharacterized protein YneF (UPF0154 family)